MRCLHSHSCEYRKILLRNHRLHVSQTLISFSLPFWISWPFSISRNSLRCWAFFRSFPRILGVRQAQEILAFLVIFLAVFQKGKEKKIREFWGNSFRCEYMSRLYSHVREHRKNPGEFSYVLALCQGVVFEMEGGEKLFSPQNRINEELDKLSLLPNISTLAFLIRQGKSSQNARWGPEWISRNSPDRPFSWHHFVLFGEDEVDRLGRGEQIDKQPGHWQKC